MIDASEFSNIILELQRQPLQTNNYRNKAGSGRSQAFGVVCRRCLLPDYSRQCWVRPYLYKLLLDFADKHVKIPYTSITVNQNYKAAAHKDKGNVGESFLVAFGDYTGGCLEVEEGSEKKLYDVKHTPLVLDFSKYMHSVQDFEGDRYSLVFYTARKSEGLPKPSVRFEDNKWNFYRGEEKIKGLPHPLKGRKRDSGMQMYREEKEVVIEFS
jgi:hypothetical protein